MGGMQSGTLCESADSAPVVETVPKTFQTAHT